MGKLRCRFRTSILIILLSLGLTGFLYREGLKRGNRLFHPESKESSKPSSRLVIVQKRPEEAPRDGGRRGNIVYSATPSSILLDSRQSGCPIPELQVDDPTLKHFFHDSNPLACRKEPNWVQLVNRTFLINTAAVRKHGKISCDYTHFWRMSEHKTSTKTFQNFPSGSAVPGDYARIQCKADDGASYRNVHMTIVPQKEAVERAQKISREMNSKDKSRLLGLNVYIMGLDSVSRMTFMRKLPQTYEYMTKSLGAVILKGYNIIGDGTPQAFIPILTGKTEVELPLTRKRYANAEYCNVYPMIWNDFKKAGYVTLYGEDSARVGTFTYRLKGFQEQPTDHYTRTFYTIAEGEYSHNPKYCFGSEPQHVAFWRYAQEFMLQYPRDLRKFSLMHHSYLSHDDLNLVQVADKDLLDHLKTLHKEGVLNKTLLILMSDHGHRFAKLRSTHQGQLEERLPYFSLVLPEWFRRQEKKAWANLKRNADLLITPFDIHATLEDLLNWGGKRAESDGRARSLWTEIPTNRSCGEAGVEAHWCTCLQWESLATSETVVSVAAKAVVQAINDRTSRVRRLCAPLRLAGVESARRLAPHRSLLRYRNAKDYDGFVPDLSGDAQVSFAVYQLRLRTTPGDALYEATLTHDGRNGDEVVLDLEDVSHINKFGDLPHCIIDSDYFLAKWCVCYDKIRPKEPH